MMRFGSMLRWAGRALGLLGRGGGALLRGLTGRRRHGAVQPNAGAAALLRDEAFQQRALTGADCAQTAEALEAAAGGTTGGALTFSPGAGAATVRHPTRLGESESRYHTVFTDGNYVFDPVYSDAPAPRAAYEARIRQLNGANVEISFFPAEP